MGEVYVAFDTTLQRKVALKAVRQDRRLDDEARARLLREARILSQLDHPGICRVYDYVSDGDTDYLVLELIDGRSLREAMEGALDSAAIMRIAEQVTQALIVAHAAGVVHRDLKPENIMLLPDGNAKVLDFGLARAFDPSGPIRAESSAATRLPLDIGTQFDSGSETFAGAGCTHLTIESPLHTAHGMLLGTPRYMSPEQASGEPATAASDMYAFGLVLQELYTGKAPYAMDADLPTLLERVRNAETLQPAGLSRDLADLIARLKARAPSQRPTALETGERLRWIREKPRRRLRYAFAAGLLLAAIAGGVKYTVDLAQERTAAVLAREDATRRRDQAEDLIGFMLGDLRNKLRGVGRLDVLDSVGDKAMAYFAAVPAAALSDDEMRRRSQALYQIGEVRKARGDLKGAAARFTESLDLISTLAQRDPQNPESQVSLAASHFYVGDALRLQGDLAGAMRHFSAYRDIGDALAARDPKNLDWLLESSYGHSNVASVLEALGDLEAARRELTLSLDLKRQLAAARPDHREWQEALGTGHNRLAVVLEKLGEGRAAFDHHAQDFKIRKSIAERYPDDMGAHQRLAISASFVARLAHDHGNDAQAREIYLLRLAALERLAAREPANADWQRELGIAEARMGGLERVSGNLRGAAARVQRATAILRPLAEKDLSLVRRRRDAAEADLELALVHLQAKRPAAAMEASSRAVTALDAVLAKSPADLDARRLLAEAYLVSADASARQRATQRSGEFLERARATLEPVTAEVRERRLQKTWALVLRGLGRTGEADAVAARLRESGFRPFTP